MMNQACVLQYVNVVMYMMMTKMGDVSDIGRHVRPTYSMSKEPIAHELLSSPLSPCLNTYLHYIVNMRKAVCFHNCTTFSNDIHAESTL